ncbi:MAG: sulfatase [Pirellulales bacterium]|nr:sulfatase [Pirellulales bacterium]
MLFTTNKFSFFRFHLSSLLLNRLRLTALIIAGLALCSSVSAANRDDKSRQASPPNILVLIADDWGWPHAGVYGDKAVKTPTFDRLAREGVLFNNAFVATPSCTASRGALLTGQMPHRLGEGANLHSRLLARFKTYPEILEKAGYCVGCTRKGWGPGRLDGTGRKRNPAGPQFKTFEQFLATVPEGKPFCFWFGSIDPHRPYDKSTEANTGIKLADIKVPAFLPDTPNVRQDVRDYYAEVQRFDRESGELLELLRREDKLENTIVVMTGDNGIPFPRAKTNLYDGGTHEPLAICWPKRVQGGRVVDDFVSFTDFAPTFLDAAGLDVPTDMTGRSLLKILLSDKSGMVDTTRDEVFTERERHTLCNEGNRSYPVRAIRTRDFLYIRNLRPQLWPAGNPNVNRVVRPDPYGDIDDGISKREIITRRDDPEIANYYKLACARRPAEELYDLRHDVDQQNNVADKPEYAATKTKLRKRLDRWMRETGDPRAKGETDFWDKCPYHGRIMKKGRK